MRLLHGSSAQPGWRFQTAEKYAGHMRLLPQFINATQHYVKPLLNCSNRPYSSSPRANSCCCCCCCRRDQISPVNSQELFRAWPWHPLVSACRASIHPAEPCLVSQRQTSGVALAVAVCSRLHLASYSSQNRITRGARPPGCCSHTPHRPYTFPQQALRGQQTHTPHMPYTFLQQGPAGHLAAQQRRQSDMCTCWPAPMPGSRCV